MPDATLTADEWDAETKRAVYGKPEELYVMKTEPPSADPLFPSPALLARLGSLVYHLEEYLDTGHHFDKEAARAIRESEDVEEWFASMRTMAMLPVKR